MKTTHRFRTLFSLGSAAALLLLLAGPPPALAVDADNDGIEDAIDPNPGTADQKTVFTGTGYTLTVLGSNRVANLQVTQTVFDNWQRNGSTLDDHIALLSKIYKHFADAFDYVVFVSDRDSAPMVGAETFNARNSVTGIGQDVFDQTDLYGSAGQLQTYIRMPTKFAFTTGPILHEMLHRWGEFLNGLPTNIAHWSFAGTGGQHFGWEPGTLQNLGGGLYDANGPEGTDYFATSSPRHGYGKMDLYLMGLIPASEVPDIQVADNAFFTDFNKGQFHADAIRTVTMAEVIANNGQRLPGPGDSQKYFHTLMCVLSTAPLANDAWAAYDQQSCNFSLTDDGDPTYFNFNEATGNRARMTLDYLNYDFKSFKDPLISGADNPPAGVATTYTFPGIAGATSYDQRVRQLSTLDLKDGAEAGLGNFDQATTGGYNPVQGIFPHAGANHFHLTHMTGVDQTLTLKRLIRPGATGKVKFYSRLGMAKSTEVAKVQVRPEGGVGWTTIYSQAGDGVGQTAYALKSASLAAYAGQTVELRFTWTISPPGGSYFIDFTGTDTLYGWYIDDIEISGVEEVASTDVTSLGTNLSFDFTRPASGRSVVQVRGRIGERLLRWGAEKVLGGGGTPNNLPVAMDDAFDIRGAASLNVLANDTDMDGDALRVSAVTKPAKGTAKISGKLITYTPGATFDGQDGFTYTVSDGRGGVDTATVKVRNPFLAVDGRYSAAITQGGVPAGNLDITVTKGGSFTGTVLVDGKTYKLKRTLAFDGTFTGTIKGVGLPDLALTFKVETSGGSSAISGSANGGALVIVSDTLLLNAVNADAPAGRYTFKLPGGATAGLPRGTGYATGSMSLKGRMKIVGKLADGTPFSAGVYVRADNSALINVALYKIPKGYLYGRVTFTAMNVAGNLAWVKPQQNPADTIYPLGFTTNTNLTGTTYVAPLPGSRALTYPDPGNATADVSFSGPELAATQTQNVKVSAGDKVSLAGANPLKLSLTIDRARGFFQGSFTIPTQTKGTPFSGVFDRISNSGFGVFVGAAETGQVTFTPK